MRQLNTHSEVVAALGGTFAVARLTDRKPPAVSNWLKRGVFPPWTFVRLTGALYRIECEAPARLWNMVPPPVRTRSRPAAPKHGADVDARSARSATT